MRALLAALALLVAVAPAAAAPAARRLAFVRGGTASVAATDGSGTRAVAGRGVVGVGFDAAGVLYLSRVSGKVGGGSVCDLFRPGRAVPVVRFRELTGKPTDFGTGLCAIVADPRGGLASVFAAGTAGSARTFGIDVATKHARLLGPGYDPAFTPDGRRLVVVQHRYYARGGSYEALVEGVPHRISTFRQITPTPPKGSPVAYAHPALAPDGARIAAARCDSTCSVVLGRPGGTLRTIWRAQSPGFVDVRGIAWLDDLTLLVAIGRPSSPHSNLFRLQIGRRVLEPVLTGIEDFALGPG